MLLNLYINAHRYIGLDLHLCPSVLFLSFPHKIIASFPLDLSLVCFLHFIDILSGIFFSITFSIWLLLAHRNTTEVCMQIFLNSLIDVNLM